MAEAPGAAVGAPVIQTRSLIPLVERVGNQLELRRQREQSRQDRINKEWTDMLSEMDYNGLDTVQNSTISRNHEQAMSAYTADLKKGDGQMDYTTRLQHLQSQNALKASADRMRAANANVKQMSMAMKELGYFKDDMMMRDAYNKLHQYDEATGQWMGRDDVNPDDINSMLTDSRYIDGDAYFKKDLEDFEKITAMGEQKGPYGHTIFTEVQTRDVWKRDEDGTIQRGGNGEPIPDMKMLMEELVKDPDKRKVYQSLADDANQTLPDYLYDRVMANTGYSERFQQSIGPPRATSDRTALTQRTQNNRNRVVLNKWQGIFNQSREVMDNARESNEETPTEGLYDDVTQQLPWSLAKEKKPYQVLLDRDRPGRVFIRQNEGDELVEYSHDQLPDLINRIESFNPNNKGITDLGMQEGFFDMEGKVVTTAGPQADPEETLRLSQESRAVQLHRKRLKDKYATIGQRLTGEETGAFFWKGTELKESQASKIQDELNQDFGKARLVLSQEEAEDYGMPNRVVRNLRFEVVPGDEDEVRVKIFTGDTLVETIPPEDFQKWFTSGKLVTGAASVPQGDTPGRFDPQ